MTNPSIKVPLSIGDNFYYVGYKHIVTAYQEVNADGGTIVTTATEAAILPFPDDVASKERDYLENLWGVKFTTYDFDDDDLGVCYLGYRWKS